MLVFIKGCIGFVVKFVVLNIAFFALGLTAPVVYFALPFYLLAKYPGMDLSAFGIGYMLLGPLVSAFWMVVICHWPSARKARIEGRIGTWRKDNGGYKFTLLKSFGFMLLGLVGSVAAEGLLLVKFGMVTPSNYHVFFAIAPFAVFAPVLLTFIVRFVRQDAPVDEDMARFAQYAAEKAERVKQDEKWLLAAGRTV